VIVCMWIIEVTKRFEKDFRRLSEKDRHKVLEGVQLLRDNPFIGLRLRAFQDRDYYRLRVGAYRIIYKVDKERKAIILLTIIRRKGKGNYKKIGHLM